MVKLRRIDELDRSSMNNREQCRILNSRKKYLVKVEDNIHLVNDYVQTLVNKYPNTPADIPEVYVLNHL